MLYFGRNIIAGPSFDGSSGHPPQIFHDFSAKARCSPRAMHESRRGASDRRRPHARLHRPRRAATGSREQGGCAFRGTAGAGEAGAPIRPKRLHVQNGQLRFEYRKTFDLIAELEWGEKTRKQKTQHSNRDGDRGPAHSSGGKVTEQEGVAPISICGREAGITGPDSPK